MLKMLFTTTENKKPYFCMQPILRKGDSHKQKRKNDL